MIITTNILLLIKSKKFLFFSFHPFLLSTLPHCDGGLTYLVGLFLFFNNGVDLFHRILLLLIFIEIKTAHFTIIICMAECRRYLSQKVLHGELEFLLVLLRLFLESL